LYISKVYIAGIGDYISVSVSLINFIHLRKRFENVFFKAKRVSSNTYKKQNTE